MYWKLYKVFQAMLEPYLILSKPMVIEDYYLAGLVKLILHDYLSSVDFFSKSTFPKNSFRNIIRVSNRWIQIRSNILTDLVWFQTVCRVISR